jgi:uncharacterized iron-regulated membrane protein
MPNSTRLRTMWWTLHRWIGLALALLLVPIAAVSLTGIYLGFPRTARQLMGSVAPMSPQGQRPMFGAVVRDTRLMPEGALSRALALQPGARPAVIFLPTRNSSTSERGRARGAEQQGAEQRDRGEGARDVGVVWRVQLRHAENGEIATVVVEDRSGVVERLRGPLAGDRAAQWMRRIHEGGHSGPIWQLVVFLTGIFPLVFAVTGVIMWWRGRRSRQDLAANATAGRGELQAAE